VKDKPETASVKLERLRAYRVAFDASVKEAGGGLVFAKPATDLRGANETEVGVLFFDESDNTTSRVLELFPSVHRAFVEGIAVGSFG
jgi:hypothetical protein